MAARKTQDGRVQIGGVLHAAVGSYAQTYLLVRLSIHRAWGVLPLPASTKAGFRGFYGVTEMEDLRGKFENGNHSPKNGSHF